MLAIAFAGSDEALSVRRFSVREGMSRLFEVAVEAVSPSPDVDLDALIGRPASFRLDSGLAHGGGALSRVWSGVCSFMEQVQVESAGLSTYEVRIVPALWLLTQRRGHRVYQHASVPEIVAKILDEWGIAATWHIDREAYPKLEYRVAYDETDHAFVSRLLEEAGISYYFEDEGEQGSRLVFAGEPQTREARAGGSIRYVEQPNQSAEREYVTAVRVAREAGPGKLTVRGVDYRGNVDVPLFAEAPRLGGPEEQLEHQVYAPGAFVAVGGRASDTPVADDRGIVRADEKHGLAWASRMLEGERAVRRRITYRTNVVDLSPGTVFSLDGHPRAELGAARGLLVTELRIDGSPTSEWTLAGSAVPADRPYRPAHRTPKPHVSSVQSAVVVGPRGEEIHTDELGRVRVQFHWDREGRRDAHSSCWIRVSQGWAGGGYGLMALPRVGHEVVVGFFEGDPDQPVVVGRVYSGGSRVPYKLPESRTVSAFRTATTPATGGYNELRFDDARGAELLHVQAERNLTKLVKHDETETTGHDRVIQVGQTLTLTTGRASIVLDGPDISIIAEGNVDIRGKAGVWVNEEDDDEEGDGVSVPERPRVEGDVEHYAEGIDLKGSAAFRAEVTKVLDSLGKTEAGASLIDEMGSTGQSVTIVASSSRTGASKPRDVAAASLSADGEEGEGADTVVAFNPSARPGGAPAEAVLAFSLAQARLNALGMRDTGLAGSPSAESQPAWKWWPYEEAIAMENEVREELGAPERRHY